MYDSTQGPVPARTALRDPEPLDQTPEAPAPSWRILLALLKRLPQGAISRAAGRAADIPLPHSLRRPVLGTFARAVGIDLSEAEKALDAYGSVSEFFVRRLRPGVRSWPADPRIAGSPVDGIVGQAGSVREGRLLQAKGRWYTATALLDDSEMAARYQGGVFVTIYLSPRHYHRIHAPSDGVIPFARHIPGALLPVNLPAVMHLPDLFPKNERLLCYLDTPLGQQCVAAIGALNVGRISAAFDREWNAGPGQSWVTNRRGVKGATHHYTPPVPVRQGEEIMAFHLGSTIVLLFEPGRVRLRPTIVPGHPISLGEPIADAVE